MNYLGKKLAAALTAAALANPVLAQDTLPALPDNTQSQAFLQAEQARLRRVEATVSALRHRGMEIGFALNLLQNSPHEAVKAEARQILATATDELQKNLITYTGLFRDVVYFPSLKNDGDFGPRTAALLAQVAAHANIREFLIETPMENDAVEIDHRFLRNRMKELAPQEFIHALQMVAHDLQIERKAEEDAKNNAISTAFGECVLRLNDKVFSPEVLARESNQVERDAAYVSNVVPEDCTYYLNALPLEFRQSAQIAALESLGQSAEPGSEEDDAIRDIQKWCDVFRPSQFGPDVTCLQLKI